MGKQSATQGENREDSPLEPRPPGPRPTNLDLAVAGVTQLLGVATPNHDLVANMATRYGDVVEIRDPAPLYIVSEPDLVRQVFTADARITLRGRGHRFLSALLGDGLVTSEGAEHLRNRRLVAPVFNQEHLNRYAEVVAADAARVDRDWGIRCADGRAEVDMTAQMAGLTVGIAGRTLLGADLSDRAELIAGAISDAFKSLEHFRSPLAGFLLYGPTPIARRLRRAATVVHDVVDEIVSEHEAHPRRYDGDVVSLLLAARDDDGSALSPQQIRDEVTTLLVAGHETTANLLCWSWFHLATNPDAAALLHAELDALTRPIQAQDGFEPALPVTRAVVAETLRLHPPVWSLGRRYVEPGRLGEYPVAAGTEVLLSQWVVHRDTRWWGADAEQFRPQRWLRTDGDRASACPFDAKAPGHPRSAYFPFGAGRRVCVGEGFAWMEAVLALATLASSWAPELKPGRPVREAPQITLRPRDGLPMVLVPRV